MSDARNSNQKNLQLDQQVEKEIQALVQSALEQELMRSLLEGRSLSEADLKELGEKETQKIRDRLSKEQAILEKQLAELPKEKKDTELEELLSKLNDADYAIDVFKKYGIKKYQLRTKDNHLVEVWQYDQDSEFFPIIEDQANKRAQSIFEAVKLIYQEAKREDQIPALEKVMHAFQNELKLLLETPINRESFETQWKKADTLIKQLINDLTFLWGRDHPNSIKLGKEDYARFHRRLWDAVEETIPAYKRSHILVINRHPQVQAFQYYQRGTQLVADEKKEATSYCSAHDRSKVAIPNFVYYQNGHITVDNQVAVTHSGFRHASLPPIDLYQRENSFSQKPGSLHAECVAITTQNIEALHNEMMRRFKKPEGKNPIYWINVGLLTVDQRIKGEEQGRQYRETILAADRIRSRDQLIFPIMFNFGVNSARHFHYPDIQDFENLRAFFHLFQLLKPKLLEFDAQAKMFEKYYEFFEKAIEEPLSKQIKLYDKAAKDFEVALSEIKKLNNSPPSDELKTRLQKACEKMQEIESAITIFKMQNYPALKELFGSCTAEFKKFKQSGPKEPWPDFFSMLDTAITLYAGNTWRNADNNFALQAALVNLGNALNKSDGNVVTSFNCKSNNDRSSTMAAHVDAFHARQRVVNFDPASHYRGSAFAQHPIVDTNGGGPKFAGDRHPDLNFAKFQVMTSSWSTHKLRKKYLKNILMPNEMLLGKKHDENFSAESIEAFKKKITEAKEIPHSIRTLINDEFLPFLQELLVTKNISKHVLLNQIIKAMPANLPILFKQQIVSFIQNLPDFQRKLHPALPDHEIAEEKINTYPAWQSTLDTERTFKQQVAVVFKPNPATDKVNQAYVRCVENSKDKTLAEKLALYGNLFATIQEWLEKKHGLQFHKDGNTFKLKPGSRLPAMLALEKYVLKRIEAMEKELIKENESLLNPSAGNPAASRKP